MPNQYHEYNEADFNSLPWANDFMNADPSSKEFSNAMAEADKYYGPEWTDKQLNAWGIQFEKEIENGNITPDKLPENSAIQKEAKQITDNNPQNDEVDNDAVEDFIKQMQQSQPTKQEQDEAAYRQQLNDMQLADEARNIDNYDMLHFTPEEDMPTDFMWSPGAFMRKDIGDSVRTINSYPTSQRRAALELLARINSGEIDLDQYSEDLMKANPWMDEQMFDAISSIASNDNKSGRIPVMSKSSLKRNKVSTAEPTEKETDEQNNQEIDDTVEVNLSRKEKSDLDEARARYDNINKAIDDMATMGKSKKSKAEKEADKVWLEEQELRDQVKMNPGSFLPEPYKQLVKAEPRDIDSYWEKVDNEYPFEGEAEGIEYTIRDDDENNNKPEMPTAGETFTIPPLSIKGSNSGAKTLGFNKPNINAGNINSVDNSLSLDNNDYNVAGGSTTKSSFSGGGSSGSVSSGGVVSPSTQQKQRATPGRSFGGGHVNLVGSGSNPVATATSASNGGGVTSGAVTRSSDPNMSKGGHLSESRAQLPGGWANNQVAGGNLDISAGADYQDKDVMTDEGSLLSAKLETILQEDSQTWDGNNSGDKYDPYVFFVSDGGFYYQKGRERHAIKNIDDNEANELIEVLTSNNQ